MRRPRPLASLLLSLAVYAAAAFVPSSPIVPAARACPAPAPMPLRALYTTSERVVVASVGATVVVKKEEGGYEHVRTLLNVSETLKGDAEEYASYLHRRVWPSAEGGEEDPFKFGNTLLLFLIPNQEGGYVVADLLRGVKHLPESDLRVYVKRVKELDAILRQEKPDEADIVEWLVRCAEEKATRWEGAYELWLTRGSLTQAGSTQDAAEGREPAAGPSATPPAGAAQTETPPPGQPVVLSAAYEAPTEMPDEPSTAATPNAAPPVGGFGGAGQQLITPPGGVVLGGRRLRAADFPAVHAGMLTAEQRTRLASALFAADEIEDEELMLADLVEQLGDRRLAPFLLEHLRRSPEEPPDSADRMMIVFARLRGDGQLKALAESYMEMDGYHLMEEEDEANRPEGGEESGEGSGEEAERELTEEEERAEQARYEARYEAAEKVAAQRRVELLRRFLSLADEQPAEPRAAP